MPRRVVTGVNQSGKSVFVSDSEVEGTVVPGSGTMYDVWGVDGTFDAPNDGTSLSYTTFFPPAEGFRYIVAMFPPDSSGEDAAALPEDVDAVLPGASEFLEVDNPGMSLRAVAFGVAVCLGFMSAHGSSVAQRGKRAARELSRQGIANRRSGGGACRPQ